MIRAFFLFFVIMCLAFLAAWAADNPGGLIIQWQNWEIQTSLALGVVAFVFILICILIIYRVIVGARAVPGSLSMFFRRRRQIKGLEVISKGLIAVASGDAVSARKYALSAAQGGAGDPALARLLGAQAAQLSGDEAETEKFFQAMLEAPETKILGLRGLLTHATRRGDTKNALDYAEAAFALQPKSPWAFQALLDLQTGGGDWRAALATLKTGNKSGLIPLQAAERCEAVLLTARAGHVLAQGDRSEAERLSVKAFRLLPSFAPSALLAARLYLENDKSWKAAGILEEAWRAAPHPTLVEAYSALGANETAHTRAKRLSGLADMKPDDSESRLLLARQAINTRDWEQARSALAPLVKQAPTARVCTLMGEIEQEEHSDVGASREWLARAVSAPPEPDWIRERFEFDDKDWARLAKEMAEPESQWPPRMDPALFIHAGGAPGPFAGVLRTGKTAQIIQSDPHQGVGRAELFRRDQRSAVVVDAPPVQDGVQMSGEGGDMDAASPQALRSKPGGEKAPLRSVPAIHRSRFKKPITRPSLPAKRPARKNVKLGPKPQRAFADQEKAQFLNEGRRFSSPPIHHGMAADVPPPPDDPGPDFDADE